LAATTNSLRRDRRGGAANVAPGAGGRLAIVSLIAIAILIVLPGCAARAQTGSRFIHGGEPTVSYGPPLNMAGKRIARDKAQEERQKQAASSPKSSFVPTIEGRDPVLGAALLRLAAEETAENHRLVAAAYINAGIPDFAYRHLRSALKLNPYDARSFEGLARLWRDWEQPGLALSDAYRAVYYDAQSPGVYNTLGTVMQALGQDANARHAFEHALRLDPGAVFALNNLCYLSLLEERDSEAESFCGKALTLDPANAVAANNLAIARAIQGDVAGAETLLLANPSVATGHYNVGMLRLSLGRYADASEAFEAAAAAAPEFWQARRQAIAARVAGAMEQKNVDR
jgi:Flp pilus assembly protein TadD